MNSKSKWCPIRVKQSLSTEKELHSLQVFVGGVLPSVSDESLHSHFERKFGPLISAKVLRFPDGRSRGFGFVKFIREIDYKNALVTKKTILEGGEVECRPSVTRETAEGDGKQLLKSKIILFGLHKNTNEEEIQESFNMYGEIVRVKKFQCAEDRYPSHIYQGYVQFQDEISTKKLLQEFTIPKLLLLSLTVVLIYSATASCMQAKTWKDEYLRQLETKSIPEQGLQSKKSLLLYRDNNLASGHSCDELGADHQAGLVKTISSSTKDSSPSHDEQHNIRINFSLERGSEQCRRFIFVRRLHFSNQMLKPKNSSAQSNKKLAEQH